MNELVLAWHFKFIIPFNPFSSSLRRARWLHPYLGKAYWGVLIYLTGGGDGTWIWTKAVGLRNTWAPFLEAHSAPSSDLAHTPGGSSTNPWSCEIAQDSMAPRWGPSRAGSLEVTEGLCLELRGRGSASGWLCGACTVSLPSSSLLCHPLGWRTRPSVVLQLYFLQSTFPWLFMIKLQIPQRPLLPSLCCLMLQTWKHISDPKGSFQGTWGMKRKKKERKPQTHFVSKAITQTQAD